MSESVLWKAFLAGIISACSMPLGSLTAFLWNPRHRILAFLTAFGAGALLAALVIDLVGSATEKGHLLELSFGTILGSLLFTLINQVVNNSGGFLRKSSTTLVYLTQKETRHFQQRVLRLKRINLMRNLEKPLQQKLARCLLTAYYPKAATIYRQGDPSESLYIIEKGKVDLLSFPADLQKAVHLSTNDIFGKMAFLTGCPHQTIAVTTEDTKLNILPRSDFEELLQVSPHLTQTTAFPRLITGLQYL